MAPADSLLEAIDDLDDRLESLRLRMAQGLGDLEEYLREIDNARMVIVNARKLVERGTGKYPRAKTDTGPRDL